MRARVTLAATAAAALVFAAGGVLTVASFADRERSTLDRELERRAEGPGGRIDAPPPGARALRPGGAPAPLLAETGRFARVIVNGSVVQEAGDLPSADFPVPEGPGLATVEADGRKWRTFTIERPLRPPGDGPHPGRVQGPPPDQGGLLPRELAPQIQFAVDLDPVEDRIAEMRTRVALISAAGIAAAAVLAWLLGNLALRPFARLRSAVAGVSSTRDLSRRLPVDDAPEEVGQVADSVNSMLARLERSAADTERALEATRRFAADVGHELRTPLTSIRANLDAVRRNPGMPESQRQAILAETSATQDRLVALLDALQALARGDAAAALPRQDVDLADIVDAAADSARRRHPHADVGVELPAGAQVVHGWPDGLRLLADNLIENALRHGGRTVRAKLEPAAADSIVFVVDDDGPGVPADERDLIFERFARGSGAAAPGSGLGLALVAQQAALHDGRVEVSDSPLGGARFTVTVRRHDGGMSRKAVETTHADPG
jgi:signal transduction histidine kinase